MPVDPGRTATEASRQAWRNVEPGDIFFTVGGGLVGSLIRHGTSSPYGHCGVVHRVVDRGDGNVIFRTAEAFPSFPPWKAGLRFRSRAPDSVAAVVRVWRDEDERYRLLNRSWELVVARLPYAWSEIAVIGLATVLPHRLVPLSDVSEAVICSNHVAQCIDAARPEDYARFFRYPPNLMWPGGLHFDTQRLLWEQLYGNV